MAGAGQDSNLPDTPGGPPRSHGTSETIKVESGEGVFFPLNFLVEKALNRIENPECIHPSNISER